MVVLVVQSLPATCRTPAPLVARPDCLPVVLLLPLATQLRQRLDLVAQVAAVLMVVRLVRLVPVEPRAVAVVAAPVLSTHSLSATVAPVPLASS